MNARRNAQINLLQRKMGGSLRSKNYPWSREYYRRLYNTYPHLYPFSTYPWRSSSLDSLELDKYYDSLNLDRDYYELDDPLYSKRIARTNPPNTDLLSKLKDFVFEQERQMTTDLLRKITEDRKLRATDRPNLYSSKSLSRYDTPMNDPPFLNPINKKDNFYKRYNAFIKKILKPLRKTSPVKYEPPKTPKITTSPTKRNYLTKSYLDDYYYPSQFYNPYWNRYSSYPYYHRYLYDYDYQPKLQPASVPLDVESIIRKSNIDDRNYKPIKKNYVPTYKYDPFESDSYLRSSLPTWKQYYYTQKLKSKPSNESFLDYYDPYYDFFPDTASVNSTDDLNEAPALSHTNQLVDEYRDAIYEDIIQNLREKQSSRTKTPLRADRKLFGYRVPDRAPTNYFNSEPYSYPTYAPKVYREPQRFSTNYYSKDTPKPSSKPTFEENYDQVKDTGSQPDDKERNNQEDYYKTKLEDSKTLPDTRQNVVSPSIFHTKCTTPVDNSSNKYSLGNLSPKTRNVDGKLSPRTDNTSPDKKLERYRSSNTLNKIKSSYDENKQKYDTLPKRISLYKPESSSIGNKADTWPGQRRPDPSKSQYRPDEVGQYRPDEVGQYRPDEVGQYRPNEVSQYRPDEVSQYRPDEVGKYRQDEVSQYRPDEVSQYRPDEVGKYRPDEVGQYRPNEVGQYVGQRKENIYKPEISQYIADTSNEYKPDTSPTRLSKQENPSEYQSFSQQPSNKFTPINSPTKPSAELRRLNYQAASETSFTPINSPTKPRPELRRPSNYRSESEFTKTLNPVSSDDKFPPKSFTDKGRESLTNETLPESRFQRLSSTSSFGAGNAETDYGKYDPAQRQTSPTRKTRLPTSEGWQEVEPRRESSDLENLRRSSSTRSRQPTERSTISRRNSIVFDPSKPSSQSASRKNSLKPLQRRNSIQPEKRNVLQKMNHETKYDGDEQPPVSNENLESSKIEEQEEVPFRSLTQFQKKLSKEEMFPGVDELGQRNMDSAKRYIGDDLASKYDLNPEESTKISAPETNYYDENQSSYEENSKDSYGRDAYNAKEQQFYPEYNYEDTKHDSIPQGSYSDTNQGDTNKLDSYQKSYAPGESGSNNYSGSYNQSAPSNMPEENTSSQDQPQSGLFDSLGDQEHPSLVSQSSNDSRSRRSFQQSDENPDASLSISESPMRSYEPKEQEQSLNAINEETEKADKADDKPKDSANIPPTPAESTGEATAPVKPKRSIDYGKSTIPRELSRRPSRSALLSQSSDDKKLKNQSSAGELQKRMSKPKIGESKLRRTTSTFKVRPTGPAGPAKKT